jgi:hypothetical protein
MNIVYAEYTYESKKNEYTVNGYIGLELHRSKNGRTDCAAKLIYWDASGQFFLKQVGMQFRWWSSKNSLPEERQLDGPKASGECVVRRFHLRGVNAKSKFQDQ